MSNEDVLLFFFRGYDRKSGNRGSINSRALAECIKKLGCNLSRSEFETYALDTIENPDQITFNEFVDYCELCFGQSVRINRSSDIDSSVVVKDKVDSYENIDDVVEKYQSLQENINFHVEKEEDKENEKEEEKEEEKEKEKEKENKKEDEKEKEKEDEKNKEKEKSFKNPNPIFCFLYDPLAFTAIGSICRHVKNYTIGLIIPGEGEGGGGGSAGRSADSATAAAEEESVRQQVKAAIPEIGSANVIVRHGLRRLSNWNRGQYKLDIGLFADEFSPVVWVDSTARAYADPSAALAGFVDSGKLFGFLPHHLTNRPSVQSQDEKLFVPRSYFLMFNSRILKDFCVLWEELWREYITPFPFAEVRNPAPYLPDSLYLIDQYALGKAVARTVASLESDVFIIARRDLHVYETHESKITQLETHFSFSPWAVPSKQSV